MTKKPTPQPPLWCVKADGETHWLRADHAIPMAEGGMDLYGGKDADRVAFFAPGHWESVILCSARGYPTVETYPNEPEERPQRCGNVADTPANPLTVSLEKAGFKGPDMTSKDVTLDPDGGWPGNMNPEEAALYESMATTYENATSDREAMDDEGKGRMFFCRDRVVYTHPDHPAKEADYVSGLPTGPWRVMTGVGPVEPATPDPLVDHLMGQDAVKPPEAPPKGLTYKEECEYHLEQGKALCARLGLPKWQKVTPSRLGLLHRRMDAEKDSGTVEVYTPEAFWKDANKVLGNINVEKDWMTDLDMLLRVPQRGNKDHFLKAQEGGYREIAPQGDTDDGEETPF